jgi:peptidyl-tRNA hydrolase
MLDHQQKTPQKRPARGKAKAVSSVKNGLSLTLAFTSLLIFGFLLKVLCVRKDLKMGKGKIGAQCGHATLAAYEQALLERPALAESWKEHPHLPISTFAVKSEEELDSIRQRARERNLITYKIRDAGRTQIESGSGLLSIPCFLFYFPLFSV